MKNKLTTVKKFAHKHKTALAITTGVVLGAAIVTAKIALDPSVIHVTKADAIQLAESGGMLGYDSKYGELSVAMMYWKE